MIAQPHWFGQTRSTFGMVHWPDGNVRAGVVICPPIGYEAVSAHPPLRLIAEMAAANGIASLRVAFPTTGNTLRTGLADDVAEWEQAITAAVTEMRSFGISRVAVMGMRLSATVVANLTSPLSPDALVLWDPVVSGRRYTRGLRLLATEVDGGVVAAGIRFDDNTLASMSRQSLDIDELHLPALIIQRSEPTSEPALVSSDPAVVVERLTGTTHLLDTDAELAVTPTTIVGRVSAWLDTVFEHAPASALAPPALCSATGEHAAGAELSHEALRIGPAQLFAVLTTGVTTQPRHAVIFLNNGVSPAVGPGSAWLDWAANVAKSGLLAVRVDFSGLGDSPVRADAQVNDAYPTGAGDDVKDVVDVLRQRGIQVVSLVGLCSGSVLAFDAAQRTKIDHIVAINPRIDKPFHDTSHRALRSGGQTNRLLAIPLGKTPLFHTLDRIPAPIWKTLSMLRLVPRPTLAVERAVARGTSVSFVFGPEEWGLKAMRRRAPRQWAALLAHPNVAVNMVDGLDHSMFAPQGRHQVENVLCPLLAEAAAVGQASNPPNSEVTSR